jgi:hypothetical protein
MHCPLALFLCGAGDWGKEAQYFSIIVLHISVNTFLLIAEIADVMRQLFLKFFVDGVIFSGRGVERMRGTGEEEMLGSFEGFHNENKRREKNSRKSFSWENRNELRERWMEILENGLGMIWRLLEEMRVKMEQLKQSKLKVLLLTFTDEKILKTGFVFMFQLHRTLAFVILGECLNKNSLRLLVSWLVFFSTFDLWSWNFKLLWLEDPSCLNEISSLSNSSELLAI